MKQSNNKLIDRVANNVQKLLDLSYLKTFQTSPDNEKMLKISTDKIHSSIDNLMDSVSSVTGLNNISLLYSRIREIQSDSDLIDHMNKAFGDEGNIDSIMSLYMQNKYVKDQENEIDTICKYMPILEEALEYKRDLVLSADALKKDFISFKNKTGALNGLLANLDNIKDKYELEDRLIDIYYNTSKYGEEFYLVAPYSKLLNSEISKKPTNTIQTTNENTIITSYDGKLDIKYDSNVIKEMNIDIGDDSSNSEYPDSFINEAKQLNFNSVLNNKTRNTNELVPDSTIDGLVTQDKKQESVVVNGCYIKRLERSRIIPIYIEDTCLGYHYIEIDDEVSLDNFVQNINDPVMSMKKNRIELSNAEITARDNVLKGVADKITSHIDAKFINNNENLKKEIFLLMKYAHDHNNGKINFKIRFLQPEEVYHFYFKKDPKTHRGISDLYRSIIPAKLYSAITITNAFGILTRGQDKRVYYVKQSIDTNIAQIMMNTINQIKKSNFGLRDLNNLETILNITGRFNDYIIPTNGSGDSPINFEIMNGQDIQIKTELLEILEAHAVNSTGVPIEAVQMRRNQMDFAIQANSSNIKVIRHGIVRQARFQKIISPFITVIYNYEYDAQESLKVILPPAFHGNMDNTTLMVENTINLSNNLALIEYGDNPSEDQEKEIQEFKRLYCRRILGSIINTDEIDILKEKAKLNSKVKHNPNPDEE